MGITLVGGHFYQRTLFPIPKVFRLRESWLRVLWNIVTRFNYSWSSFGVCYSFLGPSCNIVRHKISLRTGQTRQPFVSYSRRRAFSIQSVDNNFCGVRILLRKPKPSSHFCRAMSIEDDARVSRLFVWKIGSSDNKNAFLRVCSLCDCFHWQEDRWRDFVLPNVLKGSYVKRRGCRLWQFSD